jgi:PTH1 family peptidyl-tRNA hydrolase
MATKKYDTVIVGIGNTGEEYEHTRHNAGRDIVELAAKTYDFPAFTFDKYMNALIAEGKIAKQRVLLVRPETYVNKSGDIFKALKLTKKDVAQNLLIIHDDLDLPVGTMKIVQNRGSGGHKGVESVMRALKTQEFARIRIGIAKPAHVKKSQNKSKVIKIVTSTFSPAEKLLFKKIAKKSVSAIETFVSEGAQRAMNEFN